MNPWYVAFCQRFQAIFGDVHTANRLAELAVAYWSQEERRG